MSNRAFVIAGDRAAVIANDIDDCRYRAAAHYVPVGVQVPVRSHGEVDTVFMLEDGLLEFMVGGAAVYLTAPDMVRVPPGVPYAYRNVGEHTAHLLVRTGKAERACKMIRGDVDHAA